MLGSGIRLASKSHFQLSHKVRSASFGFWCLGTSLFFNCWKLNGADSLRDGPAAHRYLKVDATYKTTLKQLLGTYF
jgi:hypothetical protein